VVTVSVRPDKGRHPILEGERKFLFIDSCVQIWPDADFSVAHLHGVTAYCVTAWRPFANTVEALDAALEWHRVCRANPTLTLVESHTDVTAAHDAGLASIIITAQGGEFLGGSVRRVEAFYRLGLRMMLPAYNRNNRICGGCLDSADPGLTKFGERVVEEANRVGLLLDCTHVAEGSSLDIIEHSADPVVFSHSNPNQVIANPRNISDRQIKACTDRGGVIGLVPWGPLVMKPDQPGWPTLDDFLDHLDHVVDLVGNTKQVGLGTDMSLGTYPYHLQDPWGAPEYASVADTYGAEVTSDVRSPMRALKDFNAYPEVYRFAEAAQARGYTEDDIANILGGSYLDLFERVWKPVAPLSGREA
jgi:membrane dipeptidase